MNTRLHPSTLDNLKQAINEAQEEADKWIGKTLVWKIYPGRSCSSKSTIVGRECIVQYVYFDEDSGRISVLVKTKTKDGLGFINDNDSLHRTYLDLERCFTVKV
jgi:hypothetical protein